MVNIVSKLLLFLVCFALVFSKHHQKNSKQCRALVLEGGGDKGAYQAGAVRGLYEELKEEAIYEVLSGISIGSINAVNLGFYDQGSEDEATHYLLEFWRGMEPKKLFSNWPYWLIEGMFWQNGLFNDTIFIDYLNEVLPKRDINRKLNVGATNTKTGVFVRFNESIGTQDMIFKAARASASIPGVFEQVQYKGMNLVDGGALIMVDIGGAIDRCKSEGFAEEEIVLDIILCSGDILSEADTKNFNSLQMFWRYHQISNFQKSMHWITQALADYPKVNFRYLVFPKESISDSWMPIDFSKKHIARLIDLGIKEGKEVVHQGEGAMFEHMKNYWDRASANPYYDETFGEYLQKVTKYSEETI